MKIIILALILVSISDGFLDAYWKLLKPKQSKKMKSVVSKIPRAANNLAKLDIIGLIKSYGYAVEKHTVTTPDQYILEMHRIPHAKKAKSTTKPFPVLLMHGMGCNSACYVTNDKNSLAFVLADQGYDVWMGNFRGNSFSSKHKTMKDSSNKFWDHSWHEMGIIDTPAMIDYVLKTTKKSKLFHIGHSMGAGTFYVMTSSKPEYNKKIVGHFSLGPATFLSKTSNLFLKFLAGQNSFVAALLKIFGFKYFPFDAPLIKTAVSKFCSNDDMSQLFCSPIFLMFGGMEERNINMTLFPLFLKYTPDKMSTRVMLHFLQSIKHGTFRSYDPENRKGKKGDNKKDNKGKKGKTNSKNTGKPGGQKQTRGPKDYNLKLVTAPVYIINGDKDNVVTNKDARKLFDKIGSKKKEFITVKRYSHVDHIWHVNAKKLAYDNIVRKMAVLEKGDNKKGKKTEGKDKNGKKENDKNKGKKGKEKPKKGEKKE